jgi:hypothetical protein
MKRNLFFFLKTGVNWLWMIWVSTPRKPKLGPSLINLSRRGSSRTLSLVFNENLHIFKVLHLISYGVWFFCRIFACKIKVLNGHNLKLFLNHLLLAINLIFCRSLNLGLLLCFKKYCELALNMPLFCGKQSIFSLSYLRWRGGWRGRH